MYAGSRSFKLPDRLSSSEQLPFALRVITAYRVEILPLRRTVTRCKTQHGALVDQLIEWRNKYKQTEEENRKLRQENERLRKEKNVLKQEIEKLTKTTNRYQVALFDHGNFTHPVTGDKKTKGGQVGHADTNRETHEDYTSYQKERLFVKSCGKCGHGLSRVSATKQKILLDIVINPEIVKLILESERQWCGACKMEVYARDRRTLPFTEYGINTFMMVMILRFKSHASIANIATVIAISHGLTLSKSDVTTMLARAKQYLRSRYEQLQEAVRQGAVMYADETGWLVNGQKAWLWIMANEEATVYIAAESRGKGIAEELYGTSQARCMHDGLRSYEKALPFERHCYCWAHMLRFAHEETITAKKGSKALWLKDELVRIYHLKSTCAEYTKNQLEEVLRREIDQLLTITSKSQSFQNIRTRLQTQKEGLINSLLYTPDGTNNLAERELRPMVIAKKISNGSNTFAGMETMAILGSILQTTARQTTEIIPALKGYLFDGVTDKYQQYMHASFFDDS